MKYNPSFDDKYYASGCGLFGCRPKWLQSFARGFVVVTLMVGIRSIGKIKNSLECTNSFYLQVHQQSFRLLFVLNTINH